MKKLAFAAAAILATGTAFAETAPTDVKYMGGAIEQSLTGAPGDPASGETIMGNRALGNCVACHEVTALQKFPFHGNVGPMLDGAADRWTEAELRGIVSNAKMTFDGTVMPSFYKTTGYVRPGDAFTGKAAPAEGLPPLLSAQQIEDVVAYLMTLKE